ncbi:hypothetical protein [Aquimarina algicola]|uniref:Uncharacterized protein n=1 Tax=Aquimarina algicola TaxID=2589995 RepID=A0A504J177_9FLAO|nr:hypothetical protein [Aquimarina algicola]TPN84587.1 hypothetical protein FHK87_16795 [Aquimarina algicola]
MIPNLLFLEGNYAGIVYLILLILLGPPILIAIIGLILFFTNYRKIGKILLILSGVYLVVGLGICGAMLMGF